MSYAIFIGITVGALSLLLSGWVVAAAWKEVLPACADADGNHRSIDLIGLLQKGLRSVLRRWIFALDRVFTPKFNPFGQLGALGYFFFWIVAGTGIYLFAVFDTGVHKAFASVEWFSNAQWWTRDSCAASIVMARTYWSR